MIKYELLTFIEYSNVIFCCVGIDVSTGTGFVTTITLLVRTHR